MSKNVIQNTLLVLLTMTSGCVDAISFLSLGQVFTAAMTGNTVLFGLAVAHSHGLNMFGYADALLGFIVGAAISALILRKSQRVSGWSAPVTLCFGVELLVLLLFALLTLQFHETTKVTGAMLYVLIALLAMAMGLQGEAARKIGVTGVTTTVITSTLTGLVETLIWKTTNAIQIRGEGGPAAEKKAAAPSLVAISMWIIVIIGYGMGAAICGLCIARGNFLAIWLPILIVFAVVVTATVSTFINSPERKPQISA